MITLLTPTKNRSDFLLRLLRYYRDLGFQGTICIGDSSNAFHVERTKEAIKALNGDVNVVYREFPDLNGVECVQRLLDLISTPYAAYASDDDFLVPSAMDQCVRFLESHPDYSAAHGMGTLISVESNTVYGRVKGAGHWGQPVIEDGSASQRLTNLLMNYTVAIFSVHRVETWRAMYKDASLIADWKRFGGELLQCCIAVIEGKIKQLDCLHVVRQVYDQHYPLPNEYPGSTSEDNAAVNFSTSTTEDNFDWVASKDWLPSYEIFFNRVSTELARQDRIGVAEAREMVKQAFWSYLARGLSRKWEDRYGRANAVSRDGLRRAVWTVPGAQRAWDTLHSLLPGERNKMSLPALLRRSSPYHADFMSIYRAIMSPARGTRNKLSDVEPTREPGP